MHRMTLRFVLGLIALVSASPAATVSPGFDLLTTLPGTILAGTAFNGSPLGTYNFGGAVGTQNTGSTDTIVQRNSSSTVASPPGTAPAVPIEIVALQLVTAAPADFGLGVGTYYLNLQSARGGPASIGQQTITFTSSTGGTFDWFVDLYYDLRLGAANGPIALSNHELLSAFGVAWSSNPPAGALLITGANSFLDGSTHSQDIYAATSLRACDQRGDSCLVGGPSSDVPEPGTSAIVAAGLVAFCLRLHRRVLSKP
jgi:hypothetical protein